MKFSDYALTDFFSGYFWACCVPGMLLDRTPWVASALQALLTTGHFGTQNRLTDFVYNALDHTTDGVDCRWLDLSVRR